MAPPSCTADSDGTRTDALRARGRGQRDDGGRGRLGLAERVQLHGPLLEHRLVHDGVPPVDSLRLCPTIVTNARWHSRALGQPVAFRVTVHGQEADLSFAR